MAKRVCAPLDQIPDALAKTGFILEHQVAEEFKRNGWATIGGRYYADDVDGRARELDLIAYRSHKSKELEVVTGVLVSCKKCEETTWVFLTKDKPKHDPNFDWDPVHYWTDIEPLRTYLATDNWKDSYLGAAGKLYENDFKAVRDVFAFQQVALKSAPEKKGKARTDSIEPPKVVPRDDTAIFASIVSLMKALDHEMEALPARVKGRKRLYTFTLVSVVDAPMVDVNYAGKVPVTTEVGRLTHLARYMVRKRDLAALIHFVRSDKLPQFVGVLSKLADFNARHITELVDKSYESIRWNEKVREQFIDKLKARLLWRINHILEKAKISVGSIEEVQLDFQKGKLQIEVDSFDSEELRILNTNQSVRDETARILKDVARYEGDFEYASGFPF